MILSRFVALSVSLIQKVSLLQYDSQAAILNVSNGFAQRGVPLSMVVVDWQSWSPAPRGDEDFGDGWPDPKGMVQQLAARNTQLMVSPYHNMVDCKR